MTTLELKKQGFSKTQETKFNLLNGCIEQLWTKQQIIYSEKRIIKVEYKTKSGQIKTRKILNSNAKPIKEITHKKWIILKRVAQPNFNFIESNQKLTN